VAVGKAAPVLGRVGEGIESGPEDVGNGAVAYVRASAKAIGRAAVKMRNAASRDLAPDSIPADYPMDEQVIPQQVIFKSADGMPIHGHLFLPKTGGKHPGLVFYHGGLRRQMPLGWHYMDAHAYFYAANQYFANKGYVVLSLNYRSGIGYGLDFREALNYGASGGSENPGVMGAGVYMASRPDVDPKRIASYGASYGGLLTAQALHDWSSTGGSVAKPTLDPDKQREQKRLAFESSPMAAMKTWKSPVLLIHGDDDRNVAFNQTLILTEGCGRKECRSKN
jgi:dipeptidyl aminopeptidase/acylaminoacyl peptidase